MLEFDYYIPTKIHFGPGRSQLVGQVIKGWGRKKPLIVTDEGVIGAGLAKIITQSLEKKASATKSFPM